MLPMLIDPEITDEYACQDSAYSGNCYVNLIYLGGFESKINEKSSRIHLLNNAAKERNCVKSAINACVEHVMVA
jgi:IS5 family transposase